MTEEAVHLFQNSSSKSWGKNNLTFNKEEETELWYANINI